MTNLWDAFFWGASLYSSGNHRLEEREEEEGNLSEILITKSEHWVKLSLTELLGITETRTEQQQIGLKGNFHITELTMATQLVGEGEENANTRLK